MFMRSLGLVVCIYVCICGGLWVCAVSVRIFKFKLCTEKKWGFHLLNCSLFSCWSVTLQMHMMNMEAQ